MALNRSQMRAMAAGRPMDASIDQGLRAYMLGVYNYMTIALVVTGAVALAGAQLFFTSLGADGGLTPLGAAVFGSPLQFVIMFAPLAFVLGLSFGVNKLSPAMAQILFFAFAATMGLSLSSIFAVYTETSIAKTFFVSAASFGALSLYGYTTKRDLTGFGNFLFMGLIGLIIASLVNLFTQSAAMEFAISVIGVLLFAGLTAFDTQRIKLGYYVGDDGGVAKKKSILGALALYLDFINLFLFLLRFMGNRD
jgi:FtsH-binding integral membrane protein